jgi:hypothetical protein
MIRMDWCTVMGHGTYFINIPLPRTLAGISIGAMPFRREPECDAPFATLVHIILYPAISTPGRTYPSLSLQTNLARAFSAAARSLTETIPPVSSTSMFILRTALLPSTPSTPLQQRTSTSPTRRTGSRSPSTLAQSLPSIRHSSVTLRFFGTRLIVNGL